MRFANSICASLLAITIATPALSQSTLDRTDPTQAEDRDDVPDLDTTVPPTRIVPGSDKVSPKREGTYQIGPIALVGLTAMSVGEFTDIIERYSAREVTGAELEELVNAVTFRAQSSGYVFASAAIEPQTLRAGVLRVRIDEGRLDRIRIDGDDEPAIRKQLSPLLDGRPVTRGRLERQLLLADDISGVWVRRAYFEREGQDGVLVLEAERSRASGYLTFENDGSAPVGPERLQLDLDVNGVILAADEIEATVATTPFEPDELQYARIEYTAVLNSAGTEAGVQVSHSRTDPGAYLADDDVHGRSSRIGFGVSHPFVRSRTFTVWGEAQFQFRDLRQERDGILVRHDRIPVLRIGGFLVGEVGGGRLRGRLTYSRGLSIFDATKKGDPLASRGDASAEFSSLYAWTEWQRDIASGFSVEVAARGQLTTDPLLSTEDLGLGGNSFLRGYPYSERSGDQGIMGSSELRYDWADAAGLLDNVQVYAYADGGYVDNLEDGFGSGSLASAGGGLRTDIVRGLDFDVELAVPLTGPRFDTGNENPRVNVKLRKTL